MGQRKGKGKFLKRYSRYIATIRKIKEEWNLEFEIEWLLDIEDKYVKKGWITPAQCQAIENALQAVRNMKRYRKMKEKAHAGS